LENNDEALFGKCYVRREDGLVTYTKEEIRALARDARLALTEEEIARYAEELGALASLAEVLCEIPLSGERTCDDGALFAESLREDRVAACPPREELLRVSAKSRDGYLVVPRTVEE
jgi:aspartyl-tRNA(Asn)/glutamyl-tRNA(Gln) amidotransferase subunit C